MTELARNDEQFRSWVRALRRRWLVIAVITLVAGVAGGVYGFGRSPVYRSTAQVLIQPLAGNALTPDAITSDQNLTVALQTEANLVDSAAVTRLVRSAVGTRYGKDLSGVGASVPENTQLISITYHARSASKARALAGAYATAFLRYRHDQAVDVRTGTLHDLGVQLAATRKLLTAATAAAAARHPVVGADSQKSLYASRLASLQTQIGTAQAQLVDPGQVVVPAAEPAARSWLLPAALTVAVAALGFLLGWALAMILERRADRVSARTNPEAIGVRLLATLPDRHDDPLTDELYRAEAFRRARIGLVSATPTGSVVGVSAVAAPARSAPVAVELGRSLTSAGFRVVLVDAAVDDPQVGGLLELSGVTGLSDAVLDREPVTTHAVDLDGMTVVPAGTRVERARDRYSDRILSEVFEQVRSGADYVLVVTSPLSTAYGLSVLQAAEHVVLVGVDEQTQLQAVHEAVESADAVAVAVAGLVLAPRAARPAPEDGPGPDAISSPVDAARPTATEPDADPEVGTPQAQERDGEERDGGEDDAEGDAEARGAAAPKPGARGRRVRVEAGQRGVTSGVGSDGESS